MRQGWLHKWLPIGLGVILLITIGFGLAEVLVKSLQVAPWTAEAQERLHFHTKNSTRFPGDPGAVARQVERAVFLDGGPGGVGGAPGGGQSEPADWQARVATALERLAVPLLGAGEIPPSENVRHIVALPADGEPAWSLPGIYWAAYSGSPVIFLERDRLGGGIEGIVRRLEVPVFVLAPSSLVSEDVVAGLRRIGKVVRVAGESPAEHAISVAQFRDEGADFGWGRTADAQNGYFEFVVATPAEAEAALAALPLAPSNSAALLFAAEDGGVTMPRSELRLVVGLVVPRFRLGHKPAGAQLHLGHARQPAWPHPGRRAGPYGQARPHPLGGGRLRA